MKLKQFLEQYRIETQIRNDIDYKQVTISKYSGVKLRGIKNGSKIGRKRQFLIDLEKYPNTLIFTRQGLLNGSLGLASKEVHNCVITENMPTLCVNTDIVDVNFLKYLIKSTFFLNKIKELAVVGSAQKSIHERDFLKIDIDIPSIDKQKKIVKKISLKSKFVSLLKDELHNQNQLISELKQSILQEAIQGKLSKNLREENPNIEPASRLLERVKAEKELLIADKKIKQKKSLPPIREEEIPRNLNNNKYWVRLSDICYVEKGNIGIKKAVNGDYPLVVTAKKRLSHDEFQFNTKGVIVPLVSSTGHGHASLKRIHYQEGKFAVGSILACIHPYSQNIVNMFFLYQYLSIYKEHFFVRKMKGAANVSLKIASIEETPIPLIPMQYQCNFEKQIKNIEKIEEEIKKSEANVEILMQSVLQEAF